MREKKTKPETRSPDNLNLNLEKLSQNLIRLINVYNVIHILDL